MKANTFVKKYGWTEAQDVVKNAHWENAYSDGSYYSHIDSENDVLLSDLKRLVQSHEIIEKGQGLDACKDVFLSVDSDESDYINRLGVEYKKSSEDPNDKALMLCDDGVWIDSSYLNYQLDSAYGFINLKQLKQAIADEESCL